MLGVLSEDAVRVDLEWLERVDRQQNGAGVGVDEVPVEARAQRVQNGRQMQMRQRAEVRHLRALLVISKTHEGLPVLLVDERQDRATAIVLEGDFYAVSL
eukprot:scaffold7686_cov267-Pinguiococcus_pyrenoidosus.AAC.1